MLSMYTFLPLEVKWLPMTAVCSAIMLSSTWLFLKRVDGFGETRIGRRAVALFKSFVLSWIGDRGDLLEKEIGALPEVKPAEVNLLSLRTNEEKIVANVVLPKVHYGPMGNVGSGTLPSKIHEDIKSQTSAPAIVLHGMVDHELDLASSAECEKVVDKLRKLLGEGRANSLATERVDVEVGEAKAGAQLLGDVVLVTLTCAPRRKMEDLPHGLGLKVEAKARKLGFKGVLVADAHNCADGSPLTEGDMKDLERAAYKALEEVVRKGRRSFRGGACEVSMQGSRREVGPGGIASLVFEVEGKRSAYIIIDGNNLAKGLRETLIGDVRRLGIESVEVLTTDTHVHVGVPRSERGYHAVGDRMGFDALAGYVRESVEGAASNMEGTSIRWGRGKVEVLFLDHGNMVRLLEFTREAVGAVKGAALGILIPSIIASVVVVALLARIF